ncbi:MAG: hypothetical protein HZB31_04365 [Nitrospirae bacterium]|nr:hypothetical protein [Nitrospirota bacterium]
MIKRLSNKQQYEIKTLSIKWFENAFYRKDFDKPLIEASLAWIYGLYRLPSPTIIYAKSPDECQKIAASLREEAKAKEALWNNIYGLQAQIEIERQANRMTAYKLSTAAKQDIWAGVGSNRFVRFGLEHYFRIMYEQDLERFSSDGIFANEWCCYYDFLRDLKLLTLEDFRRYREFIHDSGIFMSIYETSVAIICPHPIYARFNEKQELHCSYGPAVAWEDDFRLYYLNGRLSSEVFFMPARDIDPRLILKERNAEARKEIIKKLGVKNVIRTLGSKTIDKVGSYELIVLEIPSMNTRPTYLKMRNPSTGEWHVEGVPPTVNNCIQALAWRDGEEEYIRPIQIT